MTLSSTATRGGHALRVRYLGYREYAPVWLDMQRFTGERAAPDADEIWLVEHPPVYTLGRNGKPEHVLRPGAIPVINTDRGGQVTYHGPGQLVAYPLLNLARRGIGVRQFVTRLEDAVIQTLAGYRIGAVSRRDAPGVYVSGRKIAAIGLRIKRGCSYHGLSLNVAMDLEPFTRIHPCGYPGLAVTQLRDEGGPDEIYLAADALLGHLLANLGYPPEAARACTLDQPLGERRRDTRAGIR